MKTLLAAVCGMVACPAVAGPTLGGPMSHLLVTVFDQQVYLGFESPDMATVQMQEPGAFTGAASVLNGMGYNAQFGWLANGFVSIPPGSGVFVRTVSTSPFLSVYSESGFNPILGTTGSSNVWQWNGTMAHNWYTAEVRGEHRVRYEVFVGNASGVALTGWGSAQIELAFHYGDLPGTIGAGPSPDATGWLSGGQVRPVPGAAGLLVLGVGVVVGRRRR